MGRKGTQGRRVIVQTGSREVEKYFPKNQRKAGEHSNQKNKND